MMRLAGMICMGLAAPACASALALEFPGPEMLVVNQEIAKDSHFIATGSYSEGNVDGIAAEGVVLHQSWKVGDGGLTTLQLLAPLRDQLKASGFDVIFECEARECGGFDFRYTLRVLPEPEMHVNLGDYRYLSAKRMAGEKLEYASLIVSRSANAGFVQFTRVEPTGTAAAIVESSAIPPSAAEVGSLLDASGYAILDGIHFEAGSAELLDDSFEALESLADYLNTRPDRKVTLVGHTDAEGSLEDNIDLSKKRAASVLERLVSRHGVSRAQLFSDGVGHLSPRASNLTPEGRNRNRRVEAVLESAS